MADFHQHMVSLSDGGKTQLPSLSRQFPSSEVNMDLTMCGLLVNRAEELARLYRSKENWNQVKEVWFEERRANRSTRGSSQKIYRVLTSRFKNAPASLPNPRDLPAVFDACATVRDKAQVLYPYLVADDALVRYVVHEYVQRLSRDHPEALDFSNKTLTSLLTQFEYTDGTAYDYADSTTERWCEGFRSVMRDIGVLESQQAVVGNPPSLGTTPLLVAMGYSHEEDGDDWVESPIGLQYLFQPNNRWDELYNRAAETDAWEFVELHGGLKLRPADESYSWIIQEEEDD
ncbi:Putative inner membrane protein [Halorientalis persicus]|uniref:Putative inner membrane protein n=2 Tax=Halorientalis persicus TaxID=1367881 RepID=A0A1H8SB11_9EURY|nr:Putative inner membrane protein [Halorientalis persicus]